MGVMDKRIIKIVWEFIASIVFSVISGEIMNLFALLNGYECTLWSFSLSCRTMFVLAFCCLVLIFWGMIHVSWSLIEINFYRTKIKHFKKPFLINISKSQFERRLNDFINPLKNKNSEDDDLLATPTYLLDDTIYWRKLSRHKTELEYKTLPEQIETISVGGIEYADFIELTKRPFLGLILELAKKPGSLQITVNPRGYKEDITDTIINEKKGKRKKSKKIAEFMFKGWKEISVDLDAHLALLNWLYSLEKESK